VLDDSVVAKVARSTHPHILFSSAKALLYPLEPQSALFGTRGQRLVFEGANHDQNNHNNKPPSEGAGFGLS
jgi:hypothetical protein